MAQAFRLFKACLSVKSEVDEEFLSDPGNPQVKSDLDVVARRLAESADAYHRVAKRYIELQRAAARRG